MVKKKTSLGALAAQREAAPDPAVGTGRPSDHLVGLNFKVAPELRREIRTFAAEHDMSLKELLEEAFRKYAETQKTR